MPDASIEEIISQAQNLRYRNYILVIFFALIGSIFLSQWIGFHIVYLITPCILFIMALTGFQYAHFYHWLFMQDIDPARLLHSFQTRPFVEGRSRINLAYFCSFGIIRSELKQYRFRMANMRWDLPFLEPLEVEEEYHFDKKSFFRLKQDYLVLNKEGIYHDACAVIPWSSIGWIQINNQNSRNSEQYEIVITQLDSHRYDLDISKLDTDITFLELILKAMHKRYSVS